MHDQLPTQISAMRAAIDVVCGVDASVCSSICELPTICASSDRDRCLHDTSVCRQETDATRQTDRYRYRYKYRYKYRSIFCNQTTGPAQGTWEQHSGGGWSVREYGGFVWLEPVD